MARAVRRIRPSVVPDRRRELIEEAERREAEEQRPELLETEPRPRYSPCPEALMSHSQTR